MGLKPCKEISEAKRMVLGSEKVEGSVKGRHYEVVDFMSYVFG